MIDVSHCNPVFHHRLTTKVDLSHMVQTSDTANKMAGKPNSTTQRKQPPTLYPAKGSRHFLSTLSHFYPFISALVISYCFLKIDETV